MENRISRLDQRRQQNTSIFVAICGVFTGLCDVVAVLLDVFF